MELFIVIWITCAILAAMIVKEEHRGKAAGVGFLFGPVGALIAFALWGTK